MTDQSKPRVTIDSRRWTGDPPSATSWRGAVEGPGRRSHFNTALRLRDVVAWWSLIACLVGFGWAVSAFLRKRGEWDYFVDPMPNWIFVPAILGLALAALLLIWRASPLRNSWRTPVIGIVLTMIAGAAVLGYFAYAYRGAKPAPLARWTVSQVVDYDRCRKGRRSFLIPCDEDHRAITIGFTFADGSTATVRGYGRRKDWSCVLLRERRSFHGLKWLRREDHIDLNEKLDENGMLNVGTRSQCYQGALAH